MDKWRVIVGLLLDGKSDSLRHRAYEALDTLGIRHTSTGTLESEAITPYAVIPAIQSLMQALAEPEGGALDHLWIYIDRAQDATLYSEG